MASSSARLPSIRGDRGGGHAPAASMRWTEGASRSIYQTVPVEGEPGNIASGSPPVSARATVRGESSLRLQRGALGHDAVLHIPPERDGQFPGQRHNADALTPAARRAKATTRAFRARGFAAVWCRPRRCSCRRQNSRSVPTSTSRSLPGMTGFQLSINGRFGVSTEPDTRP